MLILGLRKGSKSKKGIDQKAIRFCLCHASLLGICCHSVPERECFAPCKEREPKSDFYERWTVEWWDIGNLPGSPRCASRPL